MSDRPEGYWQGRTRRAEAERDALRAEVERLHAAFGRILDHPRWLSIGSRDNTAELRVARVDYQRAREALGDRGSAPA